MSLSDNHLLLSVFKVAYGIVGKGRTEAYLKNSTRPIEKRLWAYISNNYDNVVVNSYSAGLDRLQRSQGDYALVLEGEEKGEAN
jgi:hypothetical protein